MEEGGRPHQLQGQLEGVGPEMATTSETHVHKITRYLFFVRRLDFAIFGYQNHRSGLDPDSDRYLAYNAGSRSESGFGSGLN
jgi:hypothetical protein